MSGGKHTPGPWVVEGYRVCGPLDARSRHKNGRLLVGGVVDELSDWRAQPSETRDEASTFREETSANARLIAAAPDLLSALEAIAPEPGPVLAKLPAHHEITVTMTAAELRVARLAIAKARGAK